MENSDLPKAKSVSFWRTLPGILTAIAGLMTAAAGLIVALNQAGLLPAARSGAPPGDNPPSPVASVPASSLTSETAPTSNVSWTAVADDVTYNIKSAKRKPFGEGEYLLVLDILVSIKTTSINFEEAYFRLEVDGVRVAPHNELSNYWIPEHADKRENVEFVVPNEAKDLRLRVGRIGSERTAVVPIALASVTSTN